MQKDEQMRMVWAHVRNEMKKNGDDVHGYVSVRVNVNVSASASRRWIEVEEIVAVYDVQVRFGQRQPGYNNRHASSE